MNNPNEDLKTYEEWNTLGRRIHKGQKSVNGKFRRDQTYDPSAVGKTMSRFGGVTSPHDDMPH